MSYILDALKKTEQERQRGATPSINSQHRKGPPRSPKRPAWWYLLIAVLLFNAGILVWWLKPWQAGKDQGRQLAETERKKPHTPAVAEKPAKRAGNGAKSIAPAATGLCNRTPCRF